MRARKGGRYRYYACARRLDSGASRCRGQAIAEGTLDDLVIDALIERVLEPERLSEMLTALAARGSERRENLRKELKGLRDKTASAKSKLKNLFALAAEGVRVDAVMRTEIARLQTEAEDLGRLIRAREADLAAPIGPISPEGLARTRTALIGRLKDGAQPQLARAYLRLLVSEISVNPREIRVSGRKDSLLKCASAPDLQPPAPAPSFAQEWRARRDSNS